MNKFTLFIIVSKYFYEHLFIALKIIRKTQTRHKNKQNLMNRFYLILKTIQKLFLL